MHCRMGHIEKQRTLSRIMLGYHIERMLRDHVCGILAMQIVGQLGAIAHVQAPLAVLHGRVIVVVLVARPVAHMAAKASIKRRIDAFPVTQMPLACYVGDVAVIGKVFD